MDDKNDRITAAWQLRRDLHAWLKANPRAVMLEIFAAFADREPETVRKAINRMRADGDVAMIGRRGVCGRYLAISSEVKSPSKVRERLRMGARKTHQITRAAARKRKDAEGTAKQAREAGRLAKAADCRVDLASKQAEIGPNGGRVYRSGDNPEIGRYSSGGQGAVVRPAIGSGMYGGDW